jgi:serine protease DegQ
VDGQDITDTTRLLNLIAQIKPGSNAKIHLVRKNRELDLEVMIGKRPPPPKQPTDDSGDQDDDGG